MAISCRRERDADEPIILYQEQASENINREYNRDSESSATDNEGQVIALTPLPSADPSTPPAPRSRTVPVSANHSLLREQNKDIITPEDFEIGPLLVFSNRAGDEAQNNVYREFVNRFFNELRQGRVPSGMIAQDSLFFLTTILNSYIERNQIPDNVRVGRVVHTRDALRLNLRMFKAQNRTEGQIILIETDQGLRVREFYGDLGILDVEYIRRNERFEPEYFRF
ncbi:MAG: hypothetical protein FWD87_04810 [Spirochaetaceae bacterium]|nr:hypothetical protein [Spirochaetaceae bacterium]